MTLHIDWVWVFVVYLLIAMASTYALERLDDRPPRKYGGVRHSIVIASLGWPLVLIGLLLLAVVLVPAYLMD